MGHRRALVIAAVALLAVGLVWGLGSAVAGSESPSPAAGKITLRLGWTNDPDNLNPFIGYESSSYEIWAINY
jgi:ABC-type nitrate/sulfonate/bicarbonate transport system substrate-binding protein